MGLEERARPGRELRHLHLSRRGGELLPPGPIHRHSLIPAGTHDVQVSVEVQAWRGSIAESRHRLEFAAVDAEGRLHAGSGDARRVTSFRSSAKPFQLLALVERGHAERFGFGDEELAVMTASHTGSPYHLRLVTGILERIGLPETMLACG